MSSQGKYGTATELCAMSELFGVEVCVIQENSPTDFSYNYGSKCGSSGKTLYLLFTGSTYEGHFRLLTPMDESPCSHVPLGMYKLVKDHASSKVTSIAPLAEVTESADEQSTDDENTTTEARQ